MKAMKTTSRQNYIVNSVPEKVWIEHFINSLTERRWKFLLTSKQAEVTESVEISKEEIEEAIKEMKLKKSPKLVNMPRELFQKC